MNKYILLIILAICWSCSFETPEKKKKLHISNLPDLPESISNNAVTEGYINGESHVFTFAGIDSSKMYSGIHLRAYKLDLKSKKWHQLPSLPDSLGKVAAGANYVKGRIYIIGGYHVFADGSERSSNRVHRFDPKTNSYMPDGKPIPVPIDDHVQMVYNDSLIFVVSGWSDKENVANVQIYDTALDTWTTGNPVPDNHTYKSFGASGTIIGDSIFYFGGASMGKFYPIQNILRKGFINPADPSDIKWSHQVIDSTVSGYRMAATSVDGRAYWLGGSTKTYNYSPEAYDGSGGVEPANRVLIYNPGTFEQDFSYELPMDLRGIAKINDSTQILVGGIGTGQKISKHAYQLTWKTED